MIRIGVERIDDPDDVLGQVLPVGVCGDDIDVPAKCMDRFFNAGPNGRTLAEVVLVPYDRAAELTDAGKDRRKLLSAAVICDDDPGETAFFKRFDQRDQALIRFISRNANDIIHNRSLSLSK